MWEHTHTHIYISYIKHTRLQYMTFAGNKVYFQFLNPSNAIRQMTI